MYLFPWFPSPCHVSYPAPLCIHPPCIPPPPLCIHPTPHFTSPPKKHKHSCAGFPTKVPYEDFMDRFWNLHPELYQDGQEKDFARAVIKSAALQGYQLGKTKVFLRAGQMAELDKIRTDKLHGAATIIQRNVRMWLARVKYQRARRAVVVLQSGTRGMLARAEARRVRRLQATIRIQSYVRMAAARARYVRARRAAVSIQAAYKGYRTRVYCKDIKYAMGGGIVWGLGVCCVLVVFCVCCVCVVLRLCCIAFVLYYNTHPHTTPPGDNVQHWPSKRHGVAIAPRSTYAHGKCLSSPCSVVGVKSWPNASSVGGVQRHERPPSCCRIRRHWRVGCTNCKLWWRHCKGSVMSSNRLSKYVMMGWGVCGRRIACMRLVCIKEKRGGIIKTGGIPTSKLTNQTSTPFSYIG